MKVVLINGSPHEFSNTYDMLMDVSKTLNSEGIETELFWIGRSPIHGCIACGRCFETHRCIFNDDQCNNIIDAVESADGIVIGSPVYFASSNGALDALLDRVFFAGDCFRHKFGAACAVARRAGTSSTLDQLNKYFTINEMPIVSSCYWNMEFGQQKGETREDYEGVYVLERLAKNMAWLIKAKAAAEENGIYPPEMDNKRPYTNFVR